MTDFFELQAYNPKNGFAFLGDYGPTENKVLNIMWDIHCSNTDKDEACLN